MGILLEILIDIYESTFRPTVTIHAPPWSTHYGITKALGRRKRTRATGSSWAALKDFVEPSEGIPCSELYISGKMDIGCAVMGYWPAVMEDRWFAYSEEVYSASEKTNQEKESFGGIRMGRNSASRLEQEPLIPQSQENEDRVLTGLRIHFHRSWSGNKMLELELEIELESPTIGRRRGGKQHTIAKLRGKTIRVESEDESISQESAKKSAVSLCQSLLRCKLTDESSLGAGKL